MSINRSRISFRPSNMEEEDDMGSLQREAEEANNLQGREFFFDLAGAGPNMNRVPAGGSWP